MHELIALAASPPGSRPTRPRYAEPSDVSVTASLRLNSRVSRSNVACASAYCLFCSWCTPRLTSALAKFGLSSTAFLIREHGLLGAVRLVVDEAVDVVDVRVLLRRVALEQIVEHELGGVVQLLVVVGERDVRGRVDVRRVDRERLARLAQRGVGIGRRLPTAPCARPRGADRPAPWPAPDRDRGSGRRPAPHRDHRDPPRRRHRCRRHRRRAATGRRSRRRRWCRRRRHRSGRRCRSSTASRPVVAAGRRAWSCPSCHRRHRRRWRARGATPRGVGSWT